MAKSSNSTNESFQNNPFSQDYTKYFRDFKMPAYDMESLMTSYRKNMEIVNSTQQVMAEATRNLVQLQTQYMKQLFEDMSQQTKETLTSSESMEEKSTGHAKSVKETIDHAISHSKEINHVVSQASNKVMETVQKRMKESVDECTTAMSKVQQSVSK